MRALFILAGAGATLATASPAAARVTYLEADAGAGACGGSIGCSVTQISMPPNPTDSSIAKADEGNSLADGSYADAHAKIVFGHMHLYADAYRASGSDAQSAAQGWVHEVFPAANLTPGLQIMTFAITGSFSTSGAVFGNFAFGLFNWDIYDSVTNLNMSGGQWDSSVAMPQATLVESFSLPAGHGYYVNEYFEAAAYSSYGFVDMADYSDTVDTYAATPGGQDVIGQSGHDYAAPPVGGVPEPATWALLTVGFCGLGGLARRRRAASPVAGAGEPA